MEKPNFKQMMQMKGAFDAFTARHPKVTAFFSGVRSKQVVPGMEVAVAVRYPDGSEYKTGIRVTEEDIEMLRTLQQMK